MPRIPTDIWIQVRDHQASAIYRTLISALWFLATILNAAPSEAATSDELSRETRFLSALSDIEQRQFSSAIKTLRSVLAEDPSLVRVRLELARTYYLAEEWSLARQEFFFVLSSKLPKEVKAKVLAYIASIDGRRGFDWDFSLAVVSAGDSRRYDSDVIPLSFGGAVLPFKMERARVKSPGLLANGRFTIREEILKFSKNQSVLAYLSSDFSILKTLYEILDDHYAGLRPGVRLTFPKATVDFSLATSRRWRSGGLIEDGQEAKAAFEARTAAGSSYFGWLTGYRNKSISGADLSRRGVEVSLGFRRSFLGTGEWGMRVEGGQLKYAKSFNSHSHSGLSLFFSIDAGFGLQVSPRLRILRRWYDDVNPLYSSSPDETVSELTIQVRKTDRIIGDGFVPFIEVSGIRSKSGIDALSYRDHAVSTGLSRSF